MSPTTRRLIVLGLLVVMGIWGMVSAANSIGDWMDDQGQQIQQHNAQVLELQKQLKR